MGTVLSRILSPAWLVYFTVAITQFAQGFYLGAYLELPAGFVLLDWVLFFWVIGWWVRTDQRKRGVGLAYDTGFFLVIAWPIFMSYYLLKTRGERGLLIILAFAGTYLGAAMIGAILSATINAFRQ